MHWPASPAERIHGEQDHVALVAARGLRDTNYILRVAAGPLELGVAIGLITALALTRLLGSQLWHMSPLDPMTFAAVIVLLFAVGLGACLWPVRLAASVDSAIALRSE
jgi:hypothetical protein